MSARTGLKKSRPNVKKLFQLYDQEKKGFISKENLKSVAKDL